MIVPLVFFTAGLTLASGGTAVAQTAPPRAPGQTSMQALDTNRDGSISRIEATSLPSLSAQFRLLDQNQNGALEPAEFARFETLGAETPPGEPPGNPPAGTRPPPLGSTPPPDSTTPAPDGSRPPPIPR